MNDPVVFLYYLVAILALFTIASGIATLLDQRAERRARDEARAEARAKRREETERSDAMDSYSWQD